MSYILDRKFHSLGNGHTLLSSAQIQLDAGFGNFKESASESSALMAMTLGGMAYRATKLALMSAGLSTSGAWPLLARLSAPVVALASEVTVFRNAQSLLGSSSYLLSSAQSSWSLDFIHFASFKIFALASVHKNPFFSHVLQDVGAVLGHHLTYALNLTTHPEGHWIEQLVYAEVNNLKMQAGMALGHRLIPGLLVRAQSEETQIHQLASSPFNHGKLLRHREMPIFRSSGEEMKRVFDRRESFPEIKLGLTIHGEMTSGRADEWGRAVLKNTELPSLRSLVRVETKAHRITELWEDRARGIRSTLNEYLGQVPTRRSLSELRWGEEVREENYIRHHISYQSEEGEWISAYILRPSGEGSFPAVIAMHQTTPHGKAEVAGLVGNENYAYGKELAMRGYVVLIPDTITAGERIYEGAQPYQTYPFYQRHPRWSALGKMLWDHQRGLDVLETLSFVDSKRIAAIGQSLGGHNAMLLAAMDSRIQAVVISGGYQTIASDPRRLRWAREDETRFVYWPQLRQILKEGRNDELPFDFNEIMALILPRPLMQISGTQDQVFPGYASLIQVHRQLSDLASRLGVDPRNIVSSFFEGPHDFPARQRQEAYDFLNRHLRCKPSTTFYNSCR